MRLFAPTHKLQVLHTQPQDIAMQNCLLVQVKWMSFSYLTVNPNPTVSPTLNQFLVSIPHSLVISMHLQSLEQFVLLTFVGSSLLENF